MLCDEKIFVEGWKVLFRELLHRKENMVEIARLESFSETYARGRDDFEASLHDKRSYFEPAFTQLEHLMGNVECSVTLLKNVRSRREGAAVMNFVGVHQQADQSSTQSDRFISDLAKLSSVN